MNIIFKTMFEIKRIFCQVLTRGGFTGMEEITKYLPGGVHSENHVKASKGNYETSDCQKCPSVLLNLKIIINLKKNQTFVSFEMKLFVNVMLPYSRAALHTYRSYLFKIIVDTIIYHTCIHFLTRMIYYTSFCDVYLCRVFLDVNVVRIEYKQSVFFADK